MAGQIHLKHLRGTAEELDAYTGPASEIAYDKTNRTMRVQDGETEGGVALVTTTTAQTISGVKTFSVSPKVPTPSEDDMSQSVATTAFVARAVSHIGPVVVPKATTDTYGIIKVGDGLAVADGVLSIKGGVAKPYIASPATGITVPNQGFTVTGTPFMTNGLFDSLISVQYKFYKAGTLVRRYSYLTNQTSHTFTYDELSSLPIDTYDLRIQYVGNIFGNSPESDAIQIRIVNGVISDTGRFVYRHESNTGSVIVYDDFGTQRMLLVYDAAYRSGVLRWQSPASAAMPSSRWDHKYYIGNTLNVLDSSTGHDSLVSASRDVMAAKAAYMTDAYFQEAMRDTYVPIKMTAKAATDLLLGGGTSPIATYVRGLDVPYEAQVPTAYQTLVMFAEGDHIDDLDPTVASDKTKSLGKYPGVDYRWFNNTNAWAATECTDANAIRMSGAGYLTPLNKTTSSLHIAPVAELM